jgi:hypothetical protein
VLRVKRLVTASLKLILRVLRHDVIMMCKFTRLGIALNIFFYIILINPLPLLASKSQSKKDRGERLRQHGGGGEERNSDFVKGKSKYAICIFGRNCKVARAFKCTHAAPPDNTKAFMTFFFTRSGGRGRRRWAT